MSKAAVRDYFTQDAEPYRLAYDEASIRSVIFRERRRLVLDVLRNPIGRVLDIGAGPGVLTASLLGRGASECCTADLSWEVLCAARRALPPEAAHVSHLVGGDVEALPFVDRAFDSVVCVGVLQYLEQAGDAIRELARCIRPGGQLIVTFPNRESPLNRLHAAAVGMVRAGQAAVRCVGARNVSPLRLTFRRDIPNRSFSLREVTAAGLGAQLACDRAIYHCLTFPFAVPGLSSLVDAWNRRAPSGILSGRRRRWGREAVVRFIRL